ncbi:MAG TPA: hypothetical protein HPQ04_14150 [Rhodospirillaceae bacterium]|nr:hypothetical protein [Rhodospirillaceae bacterium]
MRIAGRGTVSHWTGSLWAVHDGANHVFIRPENFLKCQPAEGMAGVLTYEINPGGPTLSLVNCFRLADDPDLDHG